MNRPLLTILALIGLLWLRSSWGKISGGEFVNALGPTLQKFAAKNPYPAYKSLLENFAIPNALSIAPLVMWGEFFAGLAMVGGSLYLLLNERKNRLVVQVLLLGLLVAALLNVMFYLAAGWTSPSTDSVNLAMLAVELVGLLYLFKVYRKV